MTRISWLAGTSNPDPEARQLAWDCLVRAYWKPAYKYLRLRWRCDPERAQDWTQDFFARALEKGFLADFDPSKARFRTFLRTCLDGFASNLHQADKAQKRGGGVAPLSLDFDSAEGELTGTTPPAPDALDAYFHREWMKSLFELAVSDLQAACDAEGKARHFAVFRRYDLEAPDRSERLTYADLATEFGIPQTQVTNWLHATRARLRELLLARLRQVCMDDAEFRAEARSLFGGDQA